MDNTLDLLSLIDRPTTILDPYDLEAAMLRASLASVRVDIEAAWCGHMVHESSCYRNGRRTNAARALPMRYPSRSRTCCESKPPALLGAALRARYGSVGTRRFSSSNQLVTSATCPRLINRDHPH